MRSLPGASATTCDLWVAGKFSYVDVALLVDAGCVSRVDCGFFLSALVSAVLVGIASFSYLPSTFQALHGGTTSTRNPQVVALVAVIIGIVLASLIQVLTGYFTETSRKPVRDLMQRAGYLARGRDQRMLRQDEDAKILQSAVSSRRQIEPIATIIRSIRPCQQLHRQLQIARGPGQRPGHRHVGASRERFGAWGNMPS